MSFEGRVLYPAQQVMHGVEQQKVRSHARRDPRIVSYLYLRDYRTGCITPCYLTCALFCHSSDLHYVHPHQADATAVIDQQLRRIEDTLYSSFITQAMERRAAHRHCFSSKGQTLIELISARGLTPPSKCSSTSARLGNTLERAQSLVCYTLTLSQGVVDSLI